MLGLSDAQVLGQDGQSAPAAVPLGLSDAQVMGGASTPQAVPESDGMLSNIAGYFGQQIGGAIEGAWQKMRSDLEAAIPDPSKIPQGFWDEAKQQFGQLMATGKLPIDAFMLATSPLSGLVNATVSHPVAEGLAAIPGVQLPGETREQAVSDAEHAVNVAILAARPGAAPIRGLSDAEVTGAAGQAASPVTLPTQHADTAQGSASDAAQQSLAGGKTGTPLGSSLTANEAPTTYLEESRPPALLPQTV